jgi:hypothetical protein
VTSSTLDAQVLDYAMGCAVRLRDDPVSMLGADLLPFSKTGGREFVRQIMKCHAALGPVPMLTIINYARAGWDIADEAVRELIIDHLHRGQMLPPPLASYNMEMAAGFRPGRSRGRQKADQTLRDIAISAMVLALIERFQLRATGRGASGGSSACAIVALALNKVAKIPIDYKAVETVWLKYAPTIR